MNRVKLCIFIFVVNFVVLKKMFQSIRLQIFVPLLIVCYQMSLMNTATVNSEESALDLILLHNNDLHGRFDESSIIRTDCRPDEARNNKCFGGFARISTLVKQYRNAEQNENGPPVLYLNAGDTYTGTAWFFLFRDEIAAELMNALKPDVGVRIHCSNRVHVQLFSREQWLRHLI